MKVLALMPTPAVLAGLHFYHMKSKDVSTMFRHSVPLRGSDRP